MSTDYNVNLIARFYRGAEVQRLGQMETVALFVASRVGSRVNVRQSVVYQCSDPHVNRQEWAGIHAALDSLRIDLLREPTISGGEEGGGFRPGCLSECGAAGISPFSADCLAMCRN